MNKSVNHSIKEAWKERSISLGDSSRSVMDQSFPNSINKVIQNIHVDEICSVMPSGKIRCLDVGCGYGRLATVLEKLRTNIRIDGVDIAPEFVRFYNEKMHKHGRAFVADACKLPFRDESFDIVWMVVSLMYFPSHEDQKKVIKEIYRVLKPRGIFLLIEPNSVGEYIVRLGGLLPKLHGLIAGKKKMSTRGISFLPKQLVFLFRNAGFERVSQRGYPLVTIFLMPLVLMGKIAPQFSGWCLDHFRILDHFFPNPFLSFIVTSVGEKDI